jgi:3-oxoacyl-[acyl-carrier protein] reductase
MQIFRDRVALVTGSTGEGTGRSIAFTFAREGARVAVNYGTGNPNNVSAAEKVLAEIRALGGKGYGFKADTRNDDEVGAMIQGIIRLYGRLDFLIVNSGGAWEPNDLAEVTPAHWRSVMQAEVDGLFHCARHALPHMREAHFGRIVAVGIRTEGGPAGPPYDFHLGKSARSELVRAIAARELSNGITCNVVAPSHTPRPTMKQAVEAVKHGSAWKRRAHAVPQDTAEAVRFLCTNEASFVTGSVLELGASLV